MTPVDVTPVHATPVHVRPGQVTSGGGLRTVGSPDPPERTVPADDPSRPWIRVRIHGPLVVTGAVTLQRVANDQDAGDAGEWTRRRPLDPGDTVDVALCRCGRSASRPFCDGGHRRADVDLAVDPPAGTRSDRSRRVGNDGFAIEDDRPVCAHAGFCATSSTDVWQLAPSAATEAERDRVTRMVHRCPSGALDVLVDARVVEADAEPGIDVVDDGPYVVRGGIPVELPDGSVMEVRARRTLCRCGASSAKPLCDGSHADVGFRDA